MREEEHFWIAGPHCSTSFGHAVAMATGPVGAHALGTHEPLQVFTISFPPPPRPGSVGPRSGSPSTSTPIADAEGTRGRTGSSGPLGRGGPYCGELRIRD